MRILVVDDELPVRTALERALRLEGYEVELAADGVEALERLREAAPDALVLDVLMPRMDGIAVSTQLRARGDRTPILLLTARDAVADRVAGLDAGADDYLVKPFALEELLARLRALLQEERRVVGQRHALVRRPLARRRHARGATRRTARSSSRAPSSCCSSCSCSTRARC